MGEYVKFKGEDIKIGTCENLYYVTYGKYLDALKQGQLSYVRGNDVPGAYAVPDSGYRFRFPFPDEDKLPFGEIGNNNDFCRGVSVTIDQNIVKDESFAQSTYQMQITQQKLLYRQDDHKLCLAMVWRDPNGNSSQVEDEATMKGILKCIIKNHITDNADPVSKLFYRKMAHRILKGYRMGSPELNTSQQTKMQQDKTNNLPVKNQKRRGIR